MRVSSCRVRLPPCCLHCHLPHPPPPSHLLLRHVVSIVHHLRSECLAAAVSRPQVPCSPAIGPVCRCALAPLYPCAHHTAFQSLHYALLFHLLWPACLLLWLLTAASGGSDRHGDRTEPGSIIRGLLPLHASPQTLLQLLLLLPLLPLPLPSVTLLLTIRCHRVHPICSHCPPLLPPSLSSPSVPFSSVLLPYPPHSIRQ